jgi:hypothetical protein
MNDFFHQWLAAHANASGTLGGGIRLADGTCVCESSGEHFPPEQIEKLLQQLAQTQPQFSGADLAPRWNTWVFEQGKIRCVVRADGLLLGLAVRTETDAAQSLDKISSEFLALQF